MIINPAMRPRHCSGAIPILPRIFVGYKVSTANEQIHTTCYDGRDFGITVNGGPKFNYHVGGYNPVCMASSVI